MFLRPPGPPALQPGLRHSPGGSRGGPARLRGGAGGSWEATGPVAPSCDGHTPLWAFAFRTPLQLRVLGRGCAGSPGSDVDAPTSRNQSQPCPPGPAVETPGGAGPGASTPEQLQQGTLAPVHPRVPSPASPHRHPRGPMWGTQALPQVCLHLACFAAVARWAETERDVRTEWTASVHCLPAPACPPLHPLHPSLASPPPPP